MTIDPICEPLDKREEVEVQRYGTNVDLSGCPHPYGGYVTYSDYAKLEAANREQKAEIERFLTQAHNAEGNAVFQQRRAEAAEARIRELALMFGVPDGGRYLNDWIAKSEQLASLRASAGGEKWIEIKEGCEMPDYGEMIQAVCTSSAMEPWQEVFEATFTMGWEEMAACGVPYWKRLTWPVAPPTLPTEEKAQP